MQKQGEKIFSNQQSGMRVYMKLVMIMGVRVVNWATSKYLIVKSTMLPHHSIRKYTWIDHILIDKSIQE